jgi:hypothetical protein
MKLSLLLPCFYWPAPCLQREFQGLPHGSGRHKFLVSNLPGCRQAASSSANHCELWSNLGGAPTVLLLFDASWFMLALTATLMRATVAALQQIISTAPVQHLR